LFKRDAEVVYVFISFIIMLALGSYGLSVGCVDIRLRIIRPDWKVLLRCDIHSTLLFERAFGDMGSNLRWRE